MKKTDKNGKHKKTSRIGEVWHQLKKNKIAVASLIVLILIILVAILAPLLAPYSYEQQFRTIPFSKPTAEHLLGTDAVGRDILSRLIYGSRQSLQIGLLAVAIAAVVGIVIGVVVAMIRSSYDIVIGAVAGYFGGWIDNIIMRFLDIYQSIPYLLLCVTLAAVLGPSLKNAIIAIGVGMVPPNARLMRASILSVREMEYVEAAKSINASNLRIILRHIIPNSISPMIVSITMGMGNAILAGSAMSFIGLGAQPPIPEWGAMISDARNYMRANPMLAVYPGLAVIITVLAFNLLGDGLRDALDPRLKN